MAHILAVSHGLETAALGESVRFQTQMPSERSLVLLL
jgi:hypothetical protein